MNRKHTFKRALPDGSGAGVSSRARKDWVRRRSPRRPVFSDRSFVAEKCRTVAPMLCYMVFYLLSFMLIEHWNRLHYTVIHTAVDDLIPFVPAFVIPYFLWFPYVTCAMLFLLIVNEDAYHRLATVLVIGMTIFIGVSIIFPNIHLMRPETMPDNGIFSRAVSLLYLVDTPTNLTPSIHVFNSLAVVGAFWTWNWKRDDGRTFSTGFRIFWQAAITFLGLMITLSTMLIKQHSFSDVVIAVLLFVVTYALVYRLDFTFDGLRRGGRVLHPLRIR